MKNKWFFSRLSETICYCSCVAASDANNQQKTQTMNIIHYVNNTPHDISGFHAIFVEAMKNGFLHKDYADLFSIKILNNYNEDGSDRMIIDPA